MSRRLKTAVLTLFIISRLLGGLLVGLAPTVATAAGAEHHCETHDSNVGHHDHGGRAGHENHCSDGCQCGCAHAPGSLFLPAIHDPAASHPPEAHTADRLSVQARPDSVFKPPI